MLRAHWPEYLIEAWGMAVLLLVSGLITAVTETGLRSWPGGARRVVEGVAIASTVIGLVYSPWGRRSGAHFNPAVTVTFLALRRVRLRDALYYSVFQAIGALLGLLLAGLILGMSLREPPVRWIVTQPGTHGILVAFAAEFVIAWILMTTILWVGGNPRLMRATGLFAGGLVFLYICFEAPLSGFSMNPARTFASAAASGSWTAFWIYLVAPPAGMLTAALAARYFVRVPMLACAKLVHDRSTRCIHCGYIPTGHSHA
jgi:aquaporin Z